MTQGPTLTPTGELCPYRSQSLALQAPVAQVQTNALLDHTHSQQLLPISHFYFSPCHQIANSDFLSPPLLLLFSLYRISFFCCHMVKVFMTQLKYYLFQNYLPDVCPFSSDICILNIPTTLQLYSTWHSPLYLLAQSFSDLV